MKEVYFGVVTDNGIGGQSVFVKTGSGEPKLLKHHVRHSPDGFQWGYGGSGPADLARSILIDYYGEGTSQESEYQSFKWNIISTMKQGAGWILTGEIIDRWWNDRSRHVSALIVEQKT